MTTRAAAADRQRNTAERIIAGIMWTALVVAPLLVGGLAFFFVVRAFSGGFGVGIRSFAAVVLPLMVLTFVVAPKLSKRARHSDPSDWMTDAPSDADASGSQVSAHTDVDLVQGHERNTQISRAEWLATAAMVAVGALMMQLLTISTTIPIVELVLSAGFSLILYLWTDNRERAEPYCLGLVIGALGYVIVLGVPHV